MNSSNASRFKGVFSVTVVLTLSLILLTYIGFGEASRTYPKLEMDKLAAQGEIVKNSIDTFLQAGLSLKQFIGFQTSTQPILESDRALAEIKVVDTKGIELFKNINPQYKDILNVAQFGKNVQIASFFKDTNLPRTNRNFPIVETDSFYQVILPLRNKFESVGYLLMTMPKSIIQQTVNKNFIILLMIMGGIIVIYGLYVFFAIGHRGGGQLGITLAYSIAFFCMSVAVITALINIYSEGIQGKTKALTNSLAQRMNAALELGIEITDLDGLDKAFAEYRVLNSDISFIAYARGDKLLIHTQSSLIGQPWKERLDNFEYKIALGGTDKELHPLQIGIGIPKKVVYAQLWRSIKNFSVLFVASAFLAGLFLNLVFSFNQQQKIKEKEKIELNSTLDFKLDLIKPVCFLAVFIEGLNTSFLPIYFQKISLESGLHDTMASLLFTLFFAAYAAVLMPAGRYADKKGVRTLLLSGFFLVIVGMCLIAFTHNFYYIAFIRLLTGIGQGMVFIGMQSYILITAARGKTTQGASLIVFGYNGGMISGAAIGSLLVISMSEKGVFLLGAAIAILMFWYVWKFVPEVQTRSSAREKQSLGRSIFAFFSNLSVVMRDTEFAKTIFLIGILTKAVLTGVTIFALPLLMKKQGYAQEDIGQVLMLYAGGVLLSSHFVARYADKFGKTNLVLFWGTQGSGIGLLLMGIMGWNTPLIQNIPFLQTAFLLIGITILGLGHGFIHAPIVTHIANSPVANSLGSGTTTSVYRFLERLGHVIGPIMVSQILLFNNQQSFAIGWIGGIIIFFGALFFLFSKKIDSSQT